MARSSPQEAVSKGQTDMSPVLTTIAAAAPELLYCPIFIAEGGFITAQMPETPGLENVKTHRLRRPLFTPTSSRPPALRPWVMYLSSPNFSAFQPGLRGLPRQVQGKSSATIR